MRYNLVEIEDQIISTLQGNEYLQTRAVGIRRHAGDINAESFYDEQLLEGLTNILPFIFVQYNGRTPKVKSTTWEQRSHVLRFRLYVGAQSLHSKEIAQVDCYSMLSAIYDSLNARFPLSLQPLASDTPLLSGDRIQTADFAALSPLREADGDSELLLVNLPSIAVYVTDYQIEVLS